MSLEDPLSKISRARPSSGGWGHDAVTVWSRSSSLSNGHWMQQSQRICYHVFDQVEPTRSPWPRLFRPSTPSMPEDVDARVKLRTSGMRVIVKRAPPEDARDDENPNCSRCARDRYVARARGHDP